MEAKSKIKRTAYRLFSEKGFGATSYSEISEKSGSGRPLVQYHFPKKGDLLIEFILDVMAVISDEINLRGLRFGVEPRDTLVFGQIYYNFLLNDEGMRRLTTDIMSSRVLTREIIEDNARMTIRHFDEDGGDRAFEASILSTGGTYDLLFRSICSEDCLDADEFAVINVAAFLAIYSGIPFDDSVRSLRDDLLEKNEVEEVVAAVMKAILAA